MALCQTPHDGYQHGSAKRASIFFGGCSPKLAPLSSADELRTRPHTPELHTFKGLCSDCRRSHVQGPKASGLDAGSTEQQLFNAMTKGSRQRQPPIMDSCPPHRGTIRVIILPRLLHEGCTTTQHRASMLHEWVMRSQSRLGADDFIIFHPKLVVPHCSPWVLHPPVEPRLRDLWQHRCRRWHRCCCLTCAKSATSATLRRWNPLGKKNHFPTENGKMFCEPTKQ